MDRVVFDSNVYISMAMGSKTAKRAFRHVSEQNRLFISSHILGEIGLRLISRMKISESKSDRFVSQIYKATNRVTPAKIHFDSCRDVKDLPVLGTVVAAQAKHLVTSDNDLLVLGEFNGTQILRLGEFFNVLDVETAPYDLGRWPTLADIWSVPNPVAPAEDFAMA